MPSPANVEPQGPTTWSLSPPTPSLPQPPPAGKPHHHALPQVFRLRRNAAAHVAEIRVSSQPERPAALADVGACWLAVRCCARVVVSLAVRLGGCRRRGGRPGGS